MTALRRILSRFDSFTKNVVFVFFGTSLANCFNLLYQLFIAHYLLPEDFAAFNSLLSIVMIVATPVVLLQTGVAKYTSEFAALKRHDRVQMLISFLFKSSIAVGLVTFILIAALSRPILSALKIESMFSGLLLAALISVNWVTPALLGAIQGLELFPWLVGVSIFTGAAKVLGVWVLLAMGFTVTAALGAFLFASLAGNGLALVPLKRFLALKQPRMDLPLREIFSFLIPVAISQFSFMVLASFDMVLVRYYFSQADSGVYALAQMIGKIFLFLPGAIALVLLPRSSGLAATNQKTHAVINRSLFYCVCLSAAAAAFYNLFPVFVLKVLTGKESAPAILLGRYFSVSMSFLTVSNLIMVYLLSIKDFRFIAWCAVSIIAQILAIVFLHASLTQVSTIICINTAAFLSILLFMVYRK